MALNLIVRYEILTDRGSGIVAGNFINVYWDDSAEAIEVQKFDDAADDTGTVITSGPDLGARGVDHSIDSGGEGKISNYKYCDGDDMVTFTLRSTFPYSLQFIIPNHFQCVAGVVCDLQISDDFTVQPATDLGTSNGAIEVSATSSGGTIKFAIDDPDFNYNSGEGQESGLFAGLFSGQHTITAKDANGCVDEITITVPVAPEYGVLYRADYKDQFGRDSRIDILERAFSGAVTEVNCGDDPVIKEWVAGESGQVDKFYPIMPSRLIATLQSPSSFFFRNLFTQDERKYQVRHYKDFSAVEPGFTPDVLDTLDLWTNVAGAGQDWTTGAVPTIAITNPSGIVDSDYLKTDYGFVAGKEYSFDYELEVLGDGGSSIQIFFIDILDSSDEVIISKRGSFPFEAGTVSGNYTFIAPSGAAKIAIRVRVSVVTDQHYQINAFTNETASVAPGSAGLELQWLGYVIQSNGSEPYDKKNYDVVIEATDGLSDLQFADFLDADQNKYREDIISLTAITEILKKTDLDINIQSAINRYEADMDKTAADDPLPQCKFNPETFYHDGEILNCLDALKEILRPFGAKIQQRKGKWFIFNPEELVYETPYREFDKDGNYLTNSTVDDVQDMNDNSAANFIVMEGGPENQTLEVVPSYGKLYFEHTLLEFPSLIKSHGFEENDISIIPPGITVFNNWTVNIANAPGTEYGIKKTKSLEGEYNFFAKRPENLDYGVGVGVIALTSAPITIEYTNSDAFEFRFNYAVILETLNSSGGINFVSPAWVRLKWMLKLGDYYFNEKSGFWTTDVNLKYNSLYISTFNNDQEFKIVGGFRRVSELTEESGMVEFVFSHEATVEFTATSEADTITELKALPTADLQIGHRVKGHIEYSTASGSTEKTLGWVLIDDDAEDDGIEIVRPTDYDDPDNLRVWSLEDQFVQFRARARSSPLNENPARENKVAYNYLDNVVWRHLPGQAEPPENITIERTNNTGIKINFEEAYLLNDIDIDNINNSERTYKNFFKKLDGTPTQVWERTYRPGTGKLLELLSNDVVSQYRVPSNRIHGSFYTNKEVLPTTILNEASDGDKKYMFMSYRLSDKHCTIGYDIAELTDTITDDESEEIAADFNTDFSLDFYS